MKKTLFLSLFACLLVSSSYAKIWRVNNTPGKAADFIDFPAAHDAAASGDTIYLEPSVTYYTGGDIKKKLTIIGSGYFLDKNTGLQISGTGSKIYALNLIYNQTNNASGTKILGIESGITIKGCNNITIDRCLLSNVALNKSDINPYVKCSNVSIIRSSINYIGDVYVGSGGASFGWGNNYCDNLYVSNNIITAIYWATSQYGSSDVASAVIKNNIILEDLFVHNSTVQNNIFIETSGKNFILDNCSSTNNISTGDQFGSSNGNKNSIAPTDIFTCFNSYGPCSGDAGFILKSGSPAKGAGYAGTDCGIFGGDYPYVLSGIPNIPSIYSLNLQNNSNTLRVTISTKSNQ